MFTLTMFPALPVLLLLVLCLVVYAVIIAPRLNPLSVLPGPPLRSLFKNHLQMVLNTSRSPRAHEAFVKEYGRTLRIRGITPWDVRLFTLDPVSLSHILRSPHIYEKPWQSRRLITSLIGCGLLAAEGDAHRRQRRVAGHAFAASGDMVRGAVPVMWATGGELGRGLCSIVGDADVSHPVKVDVYNWISRATFDVIGLAGFDYRFNALHNSSNELLCAYRDMFDINNSLGRGWRGVLGLYFPVLDTLFPDNSVKTVQRCQAVISRITGQLVQEKKAKIEHGEHSGKPYEAKDLLTLLLRANLSPAVPPAQRISDTDVQHNVNTFLFAGSDTTSLALTWALVLLARSPACQTRLRAELAAAIPRAAAARAEDGNPDIPAKRRGEGHEKTDEDRDDAHTLHASLDALPYLHNVCRETLRLVPPVHSSLRVATRDDVVPTAYPVRRRGAGAKDSAESVEGAGGSVRVPRGAFVHVPVEAFNLDKEFWGSDAWEFNPDRWNQLPDAAERLPGIFSNLLTFSAGPRSCIGMRFSLIEMKIFLYVLISQFEFRECEDQRVVKTNVVLTRPYVRGQFAQGSQCPLLVSRCGDLGADVSEKV